MARRPVAARERCKPHCKISTHAYARLAQCRNTAYCVDVDTGRTKRSRPDLVKIVVKWLFLNPVCLPRINESLAAMGFADGVDSCPMLNQSHADLLLCECGPDAVVILEQRHGDQVCKPHSVDQLLWEVTFWGELDLGPPPPQSTAAADAVGRRQERLRMTRPK